MTVCRKYGVWKVRNVKMRSVKVRSVENAECGKCREQKIPECKKCGVWKVQSVG